MTRNRRPDHGERRKHTFPTRSCPGPRASVPALQRLARAAITERLDGYLEATRLLIDAGAPVTDAMADKAADEIAILLDEALGAS
jgi:hypothetical protein